MSRKEREQVLITLQIPATMKDLIERIIAADTHSNMSEFIRDAIRQKIQLEHPGLIRAMVREEIGA